MATVNVDTSLLISGGDSIKTYKDSNETYYNGVKSLSINSCPSFENFKSALDTKFNTYSTHCDIASSKIKECATELESVDGQIAGNSTNTADDTDISEIATTNIDVIVDIKSLVNLNDNERKQVFKELSSSLTDAVSNIESGNKSYKSNSNYELVNKLVDNFMDNISTTNSDGTVTYKVNDLIKNNFYNEVVKEYGAIANVKITPDMLHYASRNGLPLIREDIGEYNLTFNGNGQPTEIGQEYNFYKEGIVKGNEKTSPYSDELYNSTGSYERKYSWYPDGMTYHYNSKNWYICDDGFYRDEDGYIVCADRYNMGYNEDGSPRYVKDIIESGDAIIVDTPFGPGKVYDFCEEGNIDIYVHR